MTWPCCYAYGGLAAAQVDKGLSEQALESCNKAISIKPTVVLFILQNVIYKSLGQPLLADVAKQKAIEFLGGHLSAYTQLSKIYSKFRIYEEAEYYCKESIKIAPNEAGLHNNLASIYLAEKKNIDAKYEYQKIIEMPDKKYKKIAMRELKKISVDIRN